MRTLHCSNMTHKDNCVSADTQMVTRMRSDSVQYLRPTIQHYVTEEASKKYRHSNWRADDALYSAKSFIKITHYSINQIGFVPFKVTNHDEKGDRPNRKPL